MTVTARMYRFAAATALATGLAVPAFAQDASGDIIVTARRVEERLQDVPISITVFNQQQLDNRNVLTAGDLAATAPSLTVNSQFGNDNTSFSIRGFVQDIGTAPTVGVYFADVVAPRGGAVSVPTGDGAGAGSLFDLQNVQILNGPQGTLQGRNTTGGAVLLVPRKPTHELEGYVEGSVGNYGLWGVQAVLNLPLADTFRVRLGVDRQSRDGYVINRSGIGPRDFEDVNYTAFRASIVADLTPELENYTIASYSKSKTHGTVQKVIGASPFGTLFPFALDQVQRQQGFGFHELLQDVPDAGNETEQWQVINTTTWQASDTLTIKNIASYGEFRQRSNLALFGTQWDATVDQILPFLEITIGQANAGLAANGAPLLPTLGQLAGAGLLNGLTTALAGSLATYGSRLNYAATHTPANLDSASQSTFTEELQFQGRSGDDRLKWQAGAYFESSKPIGSSGNQTQVYSNCPGLGTAATLNCTNPLGHAVLDYLVAAQTYLGFPYFVVAPPGGYNYQTARSSFQSVGLYAQLTYALTERLKLTGGFRYTWDKQSAIAQMQFTDVTNTVSCTADPLQAPQNGCITRVEQKSGAPTWLLGLDYKPSDDVLLYAKWARGYRTGGVKADVPTSLASYRPEKVDNFEVGLKASFDGAVSGIFNADFFYNSFSNQQVMLGLSSFGNVPPASVPYNLGKSRLWGFEVNTTLNLFKGFRLDGAYTYLNTKVVSLADVPGCGLFQGFPVICTNGVPTYIAAATAIAGQPIKQSPENRFTVSAAYTLPLDDSIGRVTLGATFTHTGSQRSTFTYVGLLAAGGVTYMNTPGGVAPSTADLGILPATNLLDLHLNWKSALGLPIDLTVFATNVTNQKYYSWVPGQGPLGLETAALGAPRMFGARLRANF